MVGSHLLCLFVHRIVKAGSYSEVVAARSLQHILKAVEVIITDYFNKTDFLQGVRSIRDYLCTQRLSIAMQCIMLKVMFSL